jgi:hypothetical protein
MNRPEKLKSLEESVMKFSDLLIASTSSLLDEICFWEPKTLAPYEPLIVGSTLEIDEELFLSLFLVSILKPCLIGEKVHCSSKHFVSKFEQLCNGLSCSENYHECLEMGQERTSTKISHERPDQCD